MSSFDNLNRRQPLAGLAADLFGAEAAIGIVRIGSVNADVLFDAEAKAMTGAVPARRAEFAAGRQAARRAMGRNLPIPMALNRAPQWPAGIAGSITHAGGWAFAVTGSADQRIGADLEVDEDLPADLWPIVLTPQETAWVNAQPAPGRIARLIFSIKECAYKAQFPLSGQIFGFEVLETIVDLKNRRFDAVFQQDIAPFSVGDTLSGRFSIGDGLILTGILD